MDNDIVDFVCIRIQSELNNFKRTKTIPHDLLDGVWSIEDIESCISTFSPKHQTLAKKLIADYSKKVGQNLYSLKKSLRKEYAALARNSRTRSIDFFFPTVISRYRPDVNPVRALYYDCKELVDRYSPLNERHVWLAGLVTDLEFNNKLLEALEHDVRRLERIIKRYYWPMMKADPKNIPLELFHARQTIKDGRAYYKFFRELQSWEPDE